MTYEYKVGGEHAFSYTGENGPCEICALEKENARLRAVADAARFLALDYRKETAAYDSGWKQLFNALAALDDAEKEG